MRLFVGRGSLTKPFLATLYIKGHLAGEKATLVLPPGLCFVTKTTLTLPGGFTFTRQEPAEQVIPPPGPAGYSQVKWRITANQQGTFLILVHGPGGAVATEKVVVYVCSGIFDG